MARIWRHQLFAWQGLWRRCSLIAKYGVSSLLIAILMPGAVAAAMAVGVAQPLAAPPTQEDALALLSRVQQAARRLDYAGIFMYQQGELMQASRLVHLANVQGEGERERVELLDGQPREYLRYNEEVLHLMPARKTVLLERRASERFPGLLLGDLANLTKYYDLSLEPQLQRVADRSCQLITIEPKDNLRYGYRLCADVDTHLLLKAQTFDLTHSVVVQVAFTSVRLGNEVDREMLASRWVTRDWKMLKSPMKPVDLKAEGWQIVAPPGFLPIMQIERTMRRGVSVSQLVLSDGLAVMSVFIEPYKNQHGYSQMRGPLHRGATNIYSARVANFWLTAVGEVPAATLEKVTHSARFAPTVTNK